MRVWQSCVHELPEQGMGLRGPGCMMGLKTLAHGQHASAFPHKMEQARLLGAAEGGRSPNLVSARSSARHKQSISNRVIRTRENPEKKIIFVSLKRTARQSSKNKLIKPSLSKPYLRQQHHGKRNVGGTCASSSLAECNVKGKESVGRAVFFAPKPKRQHKAQGSLRRVRNLIC